MASSLGSSTPSASDSLEFPCTDAAQMAQLDPVWRILNRTQCWLYEPKHCLKRWKLIRKKLGSTQFFASALIQRVAGSFFLSLSLGEHSTPFPCSPPDRKGLLDFMLESAFAMLQHHAPTQYPARAARQWIPPSWIPPSIPPELLASGSRRVSRQSGSPVDPAEYPARAARPSIPPERLASGSRRVSRKSGSPVDPAEYPPRAARQWIPPSVPRQWIAEYSARVARQWSRRVSHQSSTPVDPAEMLVDPAECPARAARQWIPRRVSRKMDPTRAARQWILGAEYPAELASGSREVSRPRQWIPPSIPPEQPASGSSSSPVDPAKYPAKSSS